MESNRTDREVSDTADNRSQGRGMVAMDGKKRQRPSESFAYKSIRNGADEYKWWIEEAIDAGTVEIMRGGQNVREKAILPTAILCFELWIKQFVEGDSKGLNLVPVQNGKSRQLIRKGET